MLFVIYIYTYVHKHTHTHIYIWQTAYVYMCMYMFVVINFDALAQASDFQIERRQVLFLFRMQDLNRGLWNRISSKLNARWKTDWAIEDQAKTWTQQPVPMLLLNSMLWHRQAIHTIHIVPVHLWRTGHGRVVRTLRIIACGRVALTLWGPRSNLGSSTGHNSLITSDYPAASPRKHVLMLLPYKYVCALLFINMSSV